MKCISDEDMQEKLKEDLETHITAWKECADKEEVKALRGAISYYSTPDEDAEYEYKFQVMLHIHGINLSEDKEH